MLLENRDFGQHFKEHWDIYLVAEIRKTKFVKQLSHCQTSAKTYTCLYSRTASKKETGVKLETVDYPLPDTHEHTHTTDNIALKRQSDFSH